MPVGHGSEITGHVPEIVGHDAEITGHALPKYAINGHEPHAYIKDVLQRLPTQPASRIDELLPHRWTPQEG